MNAETNKRLAQNTLLLYFRQILVMAISLYTVRIVLEALGEIDYGIYNVVGGFVSMFNIISSSIAVAISRYLTIEIGCNNLKRAKEIFSTSIIILLMISILLWILMETIGVWFVSSKMVMPIERLPNAVWVLRFSLLAFIINLLSVPYNAIIIAYERMSIFAKISILEVLLRLLVAYILLISLIDKLILYACLTTLAALIIRAVYGVYCKRHFEESRFAFVFNKSLIRSMSSFTGWSFIGGGIVILKDQGGNLLLNLFGGPIVNAARGIAMQVNTGVFSFVSNFMMASNPMITKSYAQGDRSTMHKLILRTQKFGFFILLILLLPLCASIEYVLELWLIEVPAHTVNFIILILLYTLVECFTTPICTGIIAQGEIKIYEISLSIIYTVNIIAAYICLKIGMTVEIVFILNIIFKIFVLIALLWQSKVKYDFPIEKFTKEVLKPCILIFALSGLITYFGPWASSETFCNFLLKTVIIVNYTSLIIFFIGMTKNERLFLVEILKKRLSPIIKRFNHKP